MFQISFIFFYNFFLFHNLMFVIIKVNANVFLDNELYNGDIVVL